MAKFNEKARDVKRTVNLAGGEAFVPDEKLGLVSLLLTSFVARQFYRGAEDQLKDLVARIDSMADKEFVAKAALYARREFHMRSISHAAAAEIAYRVKEERWPKHFYSSVIQRPDDATEIMAYYLGKYGKPIPNSLKKGVSYGLRKFDAYQVAKYRGERHAVSLVDLANLTHPQPTEALDALVKGTLEAPKTWEVGLTQAGQEAESEEAKEEAKAQVWGDLIAERRLGYFALLRNLRNILEQAPEAVPAAVAMLVDARLIHKSRVLPFRYLTALNALEGVRDGGKVLPALSRALDISLANVPEFEGKTAVIVDASGSMNFVANDYPIRKAAPFAAILYKTNDADLYFFGRDAWTLSLNHADSTLTLAQRIEEQVTNQGTDFRAALRKLDRGYERLVYLSDLQGWVGHTAPTRELSAYEHRFGVRPHVYSIDLTGYGSLQFPQDRLYCLAGFSNKIFDIMGLLEQDRNALVREIEQVRFA